MNNNAHIQYIINYCNTLTTDVSVNSNTYTSLLLPPPILPPNNKLVVLVIDVKVKSLIGGGLSPVTVGEVHSPKKNKINMNTHTHIYRTAGNIMGN